MREFTVSIDLGGQKYITNVIASTEATEDEIINIAREQVRRQWVDM
ncbi:BA3454 family stress response protein [Bacillus massilinigeriensis]|nr:BA3454 family stress response protein [Bacillus mediterraneensis]